ncbi:MAG: hypothetical protein MSC31_17770 [Solirubrobacteraceae bacterium MAG38_C4-C5]|nr:hypothetical protein [Candidatus Siliceabacter maunaloa]
MRRTFLLFALSLMATLLFAVPASANLQAIVEDLRADGAIDPCAHTGGELRAALDDIGPDVDQYAPELPDLIEEALAARAGGACSEGGGSSSSTAGGSTGGGASGGGDSAAGGGTAGDLGGDGAPAGGSVEGEGATPTPETPLTASPAVIEESVPATAPASATQASDAPVPLLLLAVLGGLVALGVLAWALARWWAFEPRWLLGTRHACTEAGYRASATWAEFSDWVRLGR